MTKLIYKISLDSKMHLTVNNLINLVVNKFFFKARKIIIFIY